MLFGANSTLAKKTHLTFRQNLIKEIITTHSYTRNLTNRTGPLNHDHSMRLVERHFVRQMPQKPKTKSPTREVCALCRCE